MGKDLVFKKLKYDVFLIPKSGRSYLEGSVGKISKLSLKRGSSSFDFKIFYSDNEFYNIKYNFKDRNYKKSYFFKEGSKVINKKGMSVIKKQDINELNSFLIEHFHKILENDYILERGSSISLEYLTNDLREILRIIS